MNLTTLNPRPLIDVQNVRQLYGNAGGPARVVLDEVSLTLHENEIVGLLGRSGSGKSTLLRSIAGLLTPSGGSVAFPPKDDGQRARVSMVFQSFALFPWLTVLQNVEIGLEALHVPLDERRRRALAAID